MENRDCFEKQMFTMTTIIYAKVTVNGLIYQSQGSGFYYTEVTPTDPTKKGPQWHRLDKYWLVTNRHVLLPKVNNVEYVPDELVFCLRKNEKDTIAWEPITVKKDELLSVMKLHQDNKVDVGVVDVTSYIHKYTDEIVKKKASNNILFPTTLTNLNLPENQPITIDVTSDVIVASYPKGFYDDYNKFPIVKSGIVASAWGSKFKGLPMFQIDAQLFPGSSGGVVISKPTNIAMINGTLQYNKTKQFVLLGVYSGEFKWYEDIEIAGKKYQMGNSYGLGNVWYSYLITEIIKDGIAYSK